MFNLLSPTPPAELLTSKLFDESTFYAAFERDMKQCQQELLIESPFATSRRLGLLLPILEKLKSRGVRIAANTKDPEEQSEEYMRNEARRAMSSLQHLGVHVLYTTGHHRKLAILDRKILYEGSLNILSQMRGDAAD